MKRYILTEKQLSDRDFAVMKWVKERITSGQYFEKSDLIYAKAIADSKTQEVPIWATHFCHIGDNYEGSGECTRWERINNDLAYDNRQRT